MNPQLLKNFSQPSCAVKVRQDLVPSFNNCWHYPPELELIYFKQGEGTQFIGDNINLFHSGDVVLVGANLPHCWSFDDQYFNSETVRTDVLVTHFSDNVWNLDFLNMPENLLLKNTLEKAKRGIGIVGETKKYIGQLLEKMLVSVDYLKILLLWEALITIANSEDFKIFSSVEFQQI